MCGLSGLGKNYIMNNVKRNELLSGKLVKCYKEKLKGLH